MYQVLRNIRKQKNISARQLAEALNLKTEAAYYKKESGQIKFSLEEAKIISENLREPIERIFFADEVSEIETK